MECCSSLITEEHNIKDVIIISISLFLVGNIHSTLSSVVESNLLMFCAQELYFILQDIQFHSILSIIFSLVIFSLHDFLLK